MQRLTQAHFVREYRSIEGVHRVQQEADAANLVAAQRGAELIVECGAQLDGVAQRCRGEVGCGDRVSECVGDSVRGNGQRDICFDVGD
ncbi:hypothetical protein [Gordonia effusa]|uniref:hypothetical protein n=1 Tax=Gordonia effusa TaxID=263908 RepID=UPI00278C231E|nr:hypothetical protein [Gordonia effusa]